MFAPATALEAGKFVNFTSTLYIFFDCNNSKKRSLCCSGTLKQIKRNNTLVQRRAVLRYFCHLS